MPVHRDFVARVFRLPRDPSTASGELRALAGAAHRAILSRVLATEQRAGDRPLAHLLSIDGDVPEASFSHPLLVEAMHVIFHEHAELDRWQQS